MTLSVQGESFVPLSVQGEVICDAECTRGGHL